MASSFHLDKVHQGDNAAVLKRMPEGSVHLTITSPPYDDLMAYGGHAFDLDALALQLYRVTAPGGVLVWVAADASRGPQAARPGETGSSFRQALHLMSVGFSLHDTMIAQKTNKMPQQKYRYEQCFDYMFVLCKGPRPRVANIRREPCLHAGHTVTIPRNGDRACDGMMRPLPSQRKKEGKKVVVKDDKPLGNVWHYHTGMGHTASDRLASRHPAPFPEQLVKDHLESWSEPGDVVLDPFCGSGTTLKVAKLNDRHFVGVEVCAEYVALARERLRFYHRRTRMPDCGTRGGRPAVLRPASQVSRQAAPQMAHKPLTRCSAKDSQRQ